MVRALLSILHTCMEVHTVIPNAPKALRVEIDEDWWSFVKKQTDMNTFLSTLSAKIVQIATK